MNYTLPKLSYAYGDLEPYIDALTVEIHYDRHHRTYMNLLNEALAKHPEFASGKTAEEILSDLEKVPSDIRQVVINAGGGYINHNLYWAIFKKNGGGAPKGELLTAIEKKFGSFDAFKEELNTAAKTVFGSGWAFLVVNENKELEIVKTKNQDSPYSIGKTPIIAVDVWEHAYYLNYQNKRPDYIANIWKIFNWEVIEHLYEEAIK